MTCLSLLNTASDRETAVSDLLGGLREGLGGDVADLVMVFGSAVHAETLGPLARAIRSEGLGRTVLGCSGESILAEDREVEESPALAAWAIRLPGTTVTPLRLRFQSGGFEGWESGLASDSLILLGEPFTFPVDRFLPRVQAEEPGLRVVGGMASAGQQPGMNRLVLDDGEYTDGAVAVRLSGGLGLRTVVSQGCRPIGRPMIVTKVDRNVIRELGRRPAYEVLRETFEELDDDSKRLVQNGLHIGRVINEYQESFQRGDFLVRNVLGVDEAGGLAITDLVRVGQTVQFHVRDAETADEDLRTLLDRGGSRVRGALLFSCNGRGTRLFPGPNHDIRTVHDRLGPIPVAGFFAMGELRPIGGQNFVHGFTASLALFEEPEAT